MYDRPRVKVQKSLTNLLYNLACHSDLHRLIAISLNHLLQVASFHVLHHNAMTAFMSDLFLETDHIWAGVTTSLELYFAIYLCQVLFTSTLECDYFHSEIL